MDRYCEESEGGDIARHIWVSKTNGDWYDGYNGQEAVILDDVRSNSWKFADLLRVTDRYPIEVAIKGGFRCWCPKEIWITAPAKPEDIYKNYTTGEAFEGIEQLIRRIDDLREFTEVESDEDPDRAPIDSFTQKEVKTQWD